jgi:uncharacterized protein YtpQ (UPF0354 family)
MELLGIAVGVLLAAFVVRRLLQSPERRRAAFVAQVGAALQRAHPGEPVRYVEERFAFRLGGEPPDGPVGEAQPEEASSGDESAEVRLQNLWTEYQQVRRRDRQALVERFVGITERMAGLELPADFAAARANVMPRVRSRCYLNAAREGHPGLAQARALSSLTLAPCAELPRDYVLELVYDFPDSVASIAQKQLATWGVTVEELAGVAMGNLRVQRTNPTVFQPLQEGLFISGWQDSYDASRLLATDVIRQLDVQGAPVVFPFSRDHLLVCGSDDEEALLAAVETMATNLERTRVESLVPLLLGDDEAYTVFEPAKESELGAALAALQAEAKVGDYAEQRSWLERLNEANGEDVFVANTMAFQDEAGRIFTVGTWTEGVDTLLPETELIAFVRPGDEDETVVTPWAAALPLVREQMEATEHYPVRWRVRSFPSDEVLVQLRALATGAID